mgnify:CR=1 FL=1
MSAIVGQVLHFEFSHARIKIAVHVGSVGVMISKLVIDQVFLVRIVSVLDERDNLIVQWDKYSERREMLNGRKTILLVEIVGGFLSGTDHQTAANFAGGRQYRPALSETVVKGN